MTPPQYCNTIASIPIAFGSSFSPTWTPPPVTVHVPTVVFLLQLEDLLLDRQISSKARRQGDRRRLWLWSAFYKFGPCYLVLAASRHMASISLHRLPLSGYSFTFGPSITTRLFDSSARSSRIKTNLAEYTLLLHVENYQGPSPKATNKALLEVVNLTVLCLYFSVHTTRQGD